MESSQERIHARSEEEEDNLIRSNKKVRAKALGEEPPLNDVEMANKDSFPIAMSFRKKLMGGSSENVMEEDEEWLLEEEEDGDYNEEMEADCPSIRPTKEEKIRIGRPWRRTLIIKLLGRNISYNLLYRKIHELWKPKASMDLVAIYNRFFLAWFSP